MNLGRKGLLYSGHRIRKTCMIPIFLSKVVTDFKIYVNLSHKFREAFLLFRIGLNLKQLL